VIFGFSFSSIGYHLSFATLHPSAVSAACCRKEQIENQRGDAKLESQTSGIIIRRETHIAVKSMAKILKYRDHSSFFNDFWEFGGLYVGCCCPSNNDQQDDLESVCRKSLLILTLNVNLKRP